LFSLRAFSCFTRLPSPCFLRRSASLWGTSCSSRRFPSRAAAWARVSSCSATCGKPVR
jgi:hypothetical protein